jgi:hypothetical protein
LIPGGYFGRFSLGSVLTTGNEYVEAKKRKR